MSYIKGLQLIATHRWGFVLALAVAAVIVIVARIVASVVAKAIIEVLE